MNYLSCTYFPFDSEQVCMFSNDRDMTKCHSFSTTDHNDNDDNKAIAIPLVFSKNSQANQTKVTEKGVLTTRQRSQSGNKAQKLKGESGLIQSDQKKKQNPYIFV